jgi:hypothetical protein
MIIKKIPRQFFNAKDTYPTNIATNKYSTVILGYSTQSTSIMHILYKKILLQINTYERDKKPIPPVSKD